MSRNSAAAAAAVAAASPIDSRCTLVFPFPSLPVMSSYLSRISAFVEDPLYKNQPLKSEQLIARNCPAQRYAGHNFTLAAFQQATNALTPLTPKQQMVVRSVNEAVKNLKTKVGSATPLDVYIIAHISGDVRTYAHERCHAIFHYCPDYRKRVSGIWGTLSGKQGSAWAEQFTKHLSGMYHTDFHLDEFQAIVLNHEYECTQKTVSLLQAALPSDKSLPFIMKTINLPFTPAELAPPETRDESEEDQTSCCPSPYV